MARRIIFLLLFLVTIISANSQNGEGLYKTYCAGCHGLQLEGNSASALIKSDWKYGSEVGDLIRNVTTEIPLTDMPAWGKVLGEKDIADVVEPCPASCNGRDMGYRAWSHGRG